MEQSDRVSFVNTVLKLIERGQYSKNDQLSETVAAATSILSYVEPSLVLPFLASRFHMALETVSILFGITFGFIICFCPIQKTNFFLINPSKKSEYSSSAVFFLPLFSQH